MTHGEAEQFVNTCDPYKVYRVPIISSKAYCWLVIRTPKSPYFMPSEDNEKSLQSRMEDIEHHLRSNETEEEFRKIKWEVNQLNK